MSSPSNPNTANIYTTFGSSPSGSLNTAIRASRAPTTSDTKGPGGNFVIGQRWVYVGDSSYTLIALTPVNGIVTATWAVEGGGSSQLSSLNGDSGSATPASGAITIAGGSGVTTSASGSTVTIGLAGGSVAIDSFTPDAGTSPVVPSATGLVTMAGTANQITTTGGLNSLTFSIPSTFVASGSITATTLLAAPAVTASLGNITATNGNFVKGTAGNKDVYISVASTTTAGANSAGTVTLVGGTATVSTTAVTASSLIRIYRQTIGATGAAALGILTIGTITASTSFVINSVQAADATALQASDVSVVFWEIVN